MPGTRTVQCTLAGLATRLARGRRDGLVVLEARLDGADGANDGGPECRVFFDGDGCGCVDVAVVYEAAGSDAAARGPCLAARGGRGRSFVE